MNGLCSPFNRSPYYSAPPHATHVEAARRLRGQYPQATRLLELGAGGGQFAVSAAAEGFRVTALELRAAGVAHMLRLARERDLSLSAVQGDFYAADPGGPFDLIVYWDGFGIGSDDDQRRLLTRMAGWLAPRDTRCWTSTRRGTGPVTPGTPATPTRTRRCTGLTARPAA
ncbi:class I SAM-dependent methyltransferase [Deinococcus caeni]|uniref:class I SAM-dependent methyltransferase n=1 Tax=Deinococcus caeni TaxID=569127 RepID=UPI0036066288